MIPVAIEGQLQRAAQAVVEQSEGEAVSKLLERLASRDDASELRDGLTWLGARALVREAVAGERQRGEPQAVEVAGISWRIGQARG